MRTNPPAARTEDIGPATPFAAPESRRKGRIRTLPRSLQRAFPLSALVLCAGLIVGCGERAQQDSKAQPKTQADTDKALDLPPIADEERLVGVRQADLIGRTLPPYPKGLAEVQGVCVPSGPQPENICDYGIAVIGRENAEVEETGAYLLASRNATPDANQPSWVVTDALDTPVSPPGSELQLGGCRLEGEFRSDVVAVVAYDDNEYSSDIAWAKRLDIATGKFVEIELKRIDCLNPGYGV